MGRGRASLQIRVLHEGKLRQELKQKQWRKDVCCLLGYLPCPGPTCTRAPHSTSTFINQKSVPDRANCVHLMLAISYCLTSSQITCVKMTKNKQKAWPAQTLYFSLLVLRAYSCYLDSRNDASFSHGTVMIKWKYVIDSCNGERIATLNYLLKLLYVYYD